MNPKKLCCILISVLLFLTACSSGPDTPPPDSSAATDALQAYFAERHDGTFAVDGLQITGSEASADTVTLTCNADFTLESGAQTGTFIITFRREGSTWAVQSCRQLLTNPDIVPETVATEPSVDEGIDSSTLAIPEDAMVFEGHSYYVYDDNTIRTWEDAQLFCESLGGYLAVIASEEENTALYEYVKSKGYTQVFFGLSDAGHEGNWKWVEQEDSHYWNWHAGQPNDGERGNYVQFVDNYGDGTNSHTGEWSDSVYGVSRIYVFLCEWPGT